jgi:acetyl esterase/lipase
VKKIFQTLAALLSIFSVLAAGLLHLKNRAPRGFALWFPKLFAGALSPISGMAGVLGGLLGWISGAPLLTVLGGWGAYQAWGYLKKVVFSQGELERAFGVDWEKRIPEERAAHMLPWRWDWSFPVEPEPRCQRDLAFWRLESGRELLCDLWQPAQELPPSGLAVIYFHGSAWYLMDKDVNTRPIFRHLAAQGHVVMDVAYRLAPETDMAGMVGDVKRALTWMKTHAGEYGVDPDSIVLMGSSAGGHISMLAGFVPYHPAMTPAELRNFDLSVRAVVSLYGPADLTACYFHTYQDETTGRLTVDSERPQPNPEMAARMRRMLGERYERWGMDKDSLTGSFLYLLGGHPREIPEKYALFSPVTHVHPGCPPVFLAQGEDDLITPVEASRALAGKLREVGVPVVNLVFPQTDHGFDLALPTFNPAARVMLYELDRFLALMI